MALTDWTTTALWVRLKALGEGAEATRHYVKTWLDDVQTLLAKAGSSPLNFTLHDDGHSFRVAERMVELIPDNTLARLSDPELALLLLSAYLHDIGMNPNYEMVLKVRAFLLSGICNLPPSEADRVQKWLDETNPGMQPPLLQDIPDYERVEHIELLTAHYCRFRHNDWSEQFILNAAQRISSAPYGLFVQDLIALCKSHHFGMPELMSQSFDLRIVGAGNKLVNLRYLAAALRVADVLEFDPERTPEVIFVHRAIPISSKIFWYKDHSIVLGISKNNSSVLITARTSDAWTHKAVLDTANDVDGEFQTCANIRDQGGFSRGVKLDSADYYVWLWPPRSARDISPMPGTFEYIDGAFRPDSRRVLGLLAGTQLYENPLAAVRELLQNAFDAVKEQIALDLLNDPNADKSEVRDTRSKLHRVTLLLETRLDPKTKLDETWLVCTDTGVGMTRRIIERHLLVGGSRPRPELLQLERLCRSKGINLNRSGEFGIGVLSYFMLADNLILETRSSPEAYVDHEPHGWRFETEGLDSFGELKVAQMLPRGSIISLRIPPKNIQALMRERIEAYLNEMVTIIPCELVVKIHDWSRKWEPGWTHGPENISGDLFGFSKRLHIGWEGIQSKKAKEQSDVIEKFAAELEGECIAKLRFFGPLEGVLPEGAGCYRIYLPYFEIEGDASLFYVKLNAKVEAEPTWRSGELFEENHFWKMESSIQLSWRGFRVNNSRAIYGANARLSVSPPVACIVQVDMWNKAQVAVNRRAVAFQDSAPIENFIEGQVARLVEVFAKANSEKAAYCSLEPCWARQVSTGKEPNFRAFWVFKDRFGDEARWVWREAALPAVRELSEYDPALKQQLHKFRDIAFPIGTFTGDYKDSRLAPFCGLAPNRLILSGKDVVSTRPLLVYENGESLTFDDCIAVGFPPVWKDIFALGSQGLAPAIFNIDHPTMRLAPFVVRKSFESDYSDVDIDRILSERRLRTDEECAAYMLRLSYALDTADVWEAVIDNFGTYLHEVMVRAGFLSVSGCGKIVYLQRKSSFLVNATTASIEIQDLLEANFEFPSDSRWYF
jgi:hypothetical protein